MNRSSRLVSRDGSFNARTDAETERISRSDDKSDPIAIVGIGCRFPGANGPEEFWTLLKNGVDAIAEVPSDRFDLDQFYSPKPGTPGKVITRYGGFIENIDRFDASFFNIAPREAIRMDPQQRILLEVTWEAIEDAGEIVEHLLGSKTGVFVGMIANDYEDIIFSDPAEVDVYVNTGCARSVASGRISYAFGLQGPSLTVDTACSSSLVAVHLACQSLLSGECEQAIAAGANLVVIPQPSIGWSQARNLAPDGRCKTFDSRANGFIRSDGVGVVILKPLSAALRDRNPVYAIIRGTATNNDGRSGGLLMAPSVKGQEALLRDAYGKAGVDPSSVSYVEAHGTGTKLGDPVELTALGSVLGRDDSHNQPCMVGSVKTNIGHTEGAAGIAGLIKVALSLKNKALPASLHFLNANPEIPWDKLPFRVPTSFGEWPAHSGPALAGVNSFGISGTNAHAIVQEYPVQQESLTGDKVGSLDYLITLSAQTPEALSSLADSYKASVIPKLAERSISLPDLAYTASARRTHLDHRLAFPARSGQEVLENLDAFLAGETRAGMSVGRRDDAGPRKVVFVFPGQGSQWLGMGRELLSQEQVFRQSIERCDAAMRQEVDWSLLEVLTSDDCTNRLNEIDVVQPALFSMQVSLAALWRSWGVEPDAVVGQSMGEVATAYVAGALSLEDALSIICRRSKLLKRMSGLGSMAVVDLPVQSAQESIRGLEGLLSVAVSNSPASTVIAGDPAALNELMQRLEEEGVFCKLIKVDVASHSPQMEPLRDDLLESLSHLRPLAPSLPFYSTVTSDIIDGPACDAQYWWKNLREPVRFSATVQRLLDDEHAIFIEVSPHPILLSAVQQVFKHFGREAVTLPSTRRDEPERSVMLGTLGSLFTAGHPVDYGKLYPTGGRVVQLPLYPWQRERFWLQPQEAGMSPRQSTTLARPGVRAKSPHPLLGNHLTSAASTGTFLWEMSVGNSWLAYLDDHKVQGSTVLPAAVYFELAVAAMAQVFGQGEHVIEEVELKKALFVSDDEPRTLQLVVQIDMPGTASFKFFSLSNDAPQTGEEWELYAEGRIRSNRAKAHDRHDDSLIIDDILSRLDKTVSGDEHYLHMSQMGLDYGPGFQAVDNIRHSRDEAFAFLKLPEISTLHADKYFAHPALLDSAFQALALIIGERWPGQTYLPIALSSLRVHNKVEDHVWCYCRLNENNSPDSQTVVGDVTLVDEQGDLILEAKGLSFRALDQESARPAPELPDWLFHTEWKEKPLSGSFPDDAGSTLAGQSWLFFADSNGIADKIAFRLKSNGARVIFVRHGDSSANRQAGEYRLSQNSVDDFRDLVRDLLEHGREAVNRVAYFWGLDTPAPVNVSDATIEESNALGAQSVLHLVQALCSTTQGGETPLFLVTSGAQFTGKCEESMSVFQSPIWGLAKVIAYEHTELRATRIDLSHEPSDEEILALLDEMVSGDGEDQIALRRNRRFVARLERYNLQDSKSQPPALVAPEGRRFRLSTSAPMVLDSLSLSIMEGASPGPGEVEIEVYASGLNFRDVMKALGIYPGHELERARFGDECSGRIISVGEGVESFKPGDEVLAIADNSFASHVITSAHLVWHKPPRLSFEEAATIPIAFATAYYGLHHLARLRSGERVLIHSAGGGVGLAAVMIAGKIGAQIVATAGSDEKREFLRSFGIEHIADSRSPEFDQQVIEATGGEGVDVVLNSLGGAAIAKGISLLKPFGRFIEIGKRDIFQNHQIGLSPFRNNLSFFAVDIDQRWRQDTAFFGEMVGEVVAAIRDRSLSPLPFTLFPASQIQDAFRLMAQGRHIGKIIVSMKAENLLVEQNIEAGRPVRADATYLITGGNGGLGLAAARYLARQGARRLALLGRSNPSGEARRIIDELTAEGVEVVSLNADVSDREAMTRAIEKIKNSDAPIRGILHCAGVLDDGVLMQLTFDRFRRVMAPKVNGAWNLHTLTLDQPLDFFILFSSAASLLGSPGQGNYTTANSFLDALAHYRRGEGRPAMSINWGPWSEVGLAARPDRAGRLAHRGLGSISPAEGIAALEQLLSQDVPQVAVMPFDLSEWQNYYPVAGGSKLFSDLKSQGNHSGVASTHTRQFLLTRDLLVSAEPHERKRMLEEYLCEQLSKILGLATSKLNVSQRLNRLGLDSLMAVELKNRIEVSLNVKIPMAKLLQGPSITEFASQMLEQIAALAQAARADVATSATGAMADTSRHTPDSIDHLSDEDVDSLLIDLLNKEGLSNERSG